MSELAVLTILVSTIDKTDLFPLLGDLQVHGDRPAARSRMDKLLNPKDSLVAQGDQNFVELLEGYVGEANRKPWMILDVLRSPVRDGNFKKFVKGQISKLDAAHQRRTRMKFGNALHSLYLFHMEDVDLEIMEEIGQKILDAFVSELDIYTRIARIRFPTLQALLSYEAAMIFALDLESLFVPTDQLERMNFELTSQITKRGPGMNLSTIGREDVLHPVSVLHQARGGHDP